MIAGEKKLVAIEQHRMAARMTRHWNRDEVRIDFDGVFARNDLFDAKSPSAIVSMHYALTVESIGPALMIRDIVFVREKHPIHATQRFDPLHKLGGKSRRVDQDIPAFALRSHHQVTPRAKT